VALRGQMPLAFLVTFKVPAHVLLRAYDERWILPIPGQLPSVPSLPIPRPHYLLPAIAAHFPCGRRFHVHFMPTSDATCPCRRRCHHLICRHCCWFWLRSLRCARHRRAGRAYRAPLRFAHYLCNPYALSALCRGTVVTARELGLTLPGRRMLTWHCWRLIFPDSFLRFVDATTVRAPTSYRLRSVAVDVILPHSTLSPRMTHCQYWLAVIRPAMQPSERSFFQ